ncbi:hypothetical protein ILUMI_20751 [Ignelater luminosus]|uniref:RNA-directed DNA polymerase n=1 Tax=Ignelater luminosus TaxID=2038154 RepID=A0A8K0G494_IGNLU|nr:hypothetical protein ILUMI_20751 [Ignelater luminosus]
MEEVQIIVTPIEGIDGGTEIKVTGGIPKPIYQKLPPIHNGHVSYELKIHGVTTTRDPASKRKILSRLLAKNAGRSLQYEVVNKLKFDEKKVGIDKTMESIRASIPDFNDLKTDSLYLRLRSRLAHLTAYASVLELDADLEEKVKDENPVQQPSQILLPPVVQTQHSSKSIPVYKWNLQFSGDSKGLGVNSFLERVSELAASRNVNKDELFDSAIDFFSGKTLIGLRSIKSSLVDWDSLVSALKRDFLPSDYEDQLWNEIKNRKQGVNESVTMFIATMKSFFRRFDREIAEGSYPNGSKQSVNVFEPDLAYILENSSMSQHTPAIFYTPSHNQSSKTPDPSSAHSEEFNASASSSKGCNGSSRVFSNSKNKTSSFRDKGINFNRASNKPSNTTAMDDIKIFSLGKTDSSIPENELGVLSKDILSQAQRCKLNKVIKEFEKLGRDDKLSRTNKLVYNIDTGNASPIKQRQYLMPSLKYLGYVIDGTSGLCTNPDKVLAVINYPAPQTTTEVKRFVGMRSWYRRFIPHFSSLMALINDLIKGKKKSGKTVWTNEANDAFVNIKQALISAPVLATPDFSLPFTLQCDASEVGLGCVLTQDQAGVEKVIASASRSLSRAERNYRATEKECLAMVFGVEKFRAYIKGTTLTVITDHHSLLWLHRMRDPSGKLARWSVRLQQFNFNLAHRKGKFNVVPDALSRSPVELPCIENHDVCVGESENISHQIDLDNVDNFYKQMRQNILNQPDKYPQWSVENNFVYKFVPCKSAITFNISDWKLLVPKTQRRIILSFMHDDPTAAHLGFAKTLARVSLIHYWPKMRLDIYHYIRACKTCNSQKASTSGQFGLMGAQKKNDHCMVGERKVYYSGNNAGQHIHGVGMIKSNRVQHLRHVNRKFTRIHIEKSQTPFKMVQKKPRTIGSLYGETKQPSSTC